MFKHVGLVGAGVMGQALLHRLNLAGVRSTVYDVSDASLAEARKLGADIVASAAAVSAKVEAVHLFVRNDEQALEACTGSAGILSAAAPGTVVMLHSTVLPETTFRIAEAAAQRGIRVIDAPVTAVPPHVRDGHAVFLVGGPVDVVDLVRPHLLSLGRSVYHFGPLGAGNMAKIAKNLATAIERLAAAEVVWLAEAGGVDAETFLEMMRVEHVHPVMQRWNSIFKIENGHAIPVPASNLLDKDVGLAAQLASAKKLNARITRSAAETAAQWVALWRNGEQAG